MWRIASKSSQFLQITHGCRSTNRTYRFYEVVLRPVQTFDVEMSGYQSPCYSVETLTVETLAVVGVESSSK